MVRSGQMLDWARIVRRASRWAAGCLGPLAAGLLVVMPLDSPNAATTRSSCGKCAPASILWGAALPTWDWNQEAAFEGMLGKQVSLVSIGAPFANCGGPTCRFYYFPTSEMQQIRSHGAIPILDWSSESIPIHIREPDFRLRDLTAGRYDGFIRRFAREAAQWGQPFMLRFDWEMNGNWSMWGVNRGVNGNRPSEFVPAWRHVHDIFARAGATNVSWVWCPNVDPGHYYTNVSKLYPGAAYVDWTCLDGYNWAYAGRGGWLSFDQLFRSTYDQIVDRIAPSKPMVLGEIGARNHASQAAWITNMFRALPGYRQIHGFVWYDVPNSWDFVIHPSSPGARAFSAGIRSPSYASNVFCNLSAPIRLPFPPASPSCWAP